MKLSTTTTLYEEMIALRESDPSEQVVDITTLHKMQKKKKKKLCQHIT